MRKKYPHQLKTGQTFRYGEEWWSVQRSPGGAVSPKPAVVTAARLRDGHRETLVLAANQKV